MGTNINTLRAKTTNYVAIHIWLKLLALKIFKPLLERDFIYRVNNDVYVKKD